MSDDSHCGSIAGGVNLTSHASAQPSASAELTVTTYPEVLLTTAADLLRREQFGIATVVAHMACEVATERAFVRAFQLRGVGYLEDAVTALMNGYNLANERNRQLYTSLTNDDVHTQLFWPDFASSAKRRNRVIHEGQILGKDEAERTLVATTALIQHLALVMSG